MAPLFMGYVVRKMAKNDLKKMSEGFMEADGEKVTSWAETIATLSIVANIYCLFVLGMQIVVLFFIQ